MDTVCGKCNKVGHTGYCTNPVKGPNFSSGYGMKLNEIGWEEVRDMVQELQADGKSQKSVAKILRMRLKKVQKYWLRDGVISRDNLDDEDED